ncbi:MAG TPA: SGNH/GDSL hydrolase family protein [Polyangiaceae bacterium]|nr:SGNH/GDSL hydrolase family protein [Polyangiaceae bacterium]
MHRSLSSTSSFIFALSALAVACGSSGDEGSPSTGAQGGTAGFFTGTGGDSTAGASNGAGGSSTGNGGANTGNGGNGQSAGGNNPGSGGESTGSGGANAGNGGEQGTGGSGTGGDTSAPCITDPAQEAVILGDSYVTGFGSPALQPELAKIISSIGQYPNYAGAGCSMASGGICTGLYGNVPQQGTTALQQHPNTKLVIMDGGGNDILICSAVTYPNCAALCKAAGSSQQKVCTDIVDLAISTAGKLMTDSANAGVRDVVYFFYPHLPGANAGYSEILDYAEPKAKALCDGAETTTGGKMRCHFVDMVEPFKAAGGDGNPLNFAGDSIHPSAAGQAIIAKAVTDVMKANCLGESSGCCTSN